MTKKSHFYRRSSCLLDRPSYSIGRIFVFHVILKMNIDADKSMQCQYFHMELNFGVHNQHLKVSMSSANHHQGLSPPKSSYADHKREGNTGRFLRIRPWGGSSRKRDHTILSVDCGEMVVGDKKFGVVSYVYRIYSLNRGRRSLKNILFVNYNKNF